MVDIKEKLEQKKKKLKEFKNNFCINDKFSVENEKTYFDISQNLWSIPLWFSSLMYPNAKTCFFVEVFNCYQNLLETNDYLYRSVSQSLTTYCLKELARNKIIDLIFCNKTHQFELNEYMEMLGNYDNKNKETQMYCCYFYKKRSLNEKDIPLIKSLACLLNIDFSDIEIVSKENNIYLKMTNKYRYQQIITRRYFKNLYQQRTILYNILKEYKDYFFDDEKENSKQLLKQKKPLYNKFIRRNKNEKN